MVSPFLLRKRSSFSMWSLLLFLVIRNVTATSACMNLSTIRSQLGTQLSKASTISQGSLPRWSSYRAPDPQYVINVTHAADVSVTVRFCNHHNFSFVAQNGGNGWADTFQLGQCGIVINLAGLSGITFNSNRTQASIEGGVSVQALVDTAYENEARISTATCNCLGFLGAALGAGLSRTAGLYGLSADQLLSMDIVMASGALRHVDGRNTDLWWALKGAGPNFGIVTSAVVKANPVPRPENIAWQGALIFSEDKLEALIRTINGLYLTPHMQIDFLFAAQPNGTPFIRVVPFYVGNTSAGRAAFKSILDLGPTTDSTREFPYNEWNAFGNYGCVSAGRKPAYGVSINHLDPLTWYTLYENFKTFVAAYPEAFNSSIFVETYPVNSSTIQKGTGAFPWRKAKTHVSVFPWYANASLDNAANAWGRTTRTLLRSTDGIPGHANYINFAHGDESLKNIYGASLSRLRTLKKRYDPSNRFNQWFPIH